MFLQAEIRASGLDWKKIADMAGVCYATVANVAYGDVRFPRENTVRAILRALGWRIYARQG